MNLKEMIKRNPNLGLEIGLLMAFVFFIGLGIGRILYG